MSNKFDTEINIQTTMSEIEDNMQKYNACLAGQYPGDENTYAEKAVELGKSIGLSEEDIFEISI
jgi:hypothetical protein|tara:strand:+ start:2152 stop:2343 length:192 start_codon:yes stop_codon:yes gene_type:complete